MKTQIKKFLWFDITPRKELYKEIADCENSIKTLSDTVVLLKNQMNDKNNQIKTLTDNLKKSENSLTDMHEIIENNKNRIISLEQTIWDLEDEIRMLRECCDDDMNESY